LIKLVANLLDANLKSGAQSSVIQDFNGAAKAGNNSNISSYVSISLR